MRLRSLGYALAVALVALAASAGPAGAEAVTLSQVWGTPGTVVKAAFTKGSCPAGHTVRWDRTELDLLEPASSGVARFTVPKAASYGRHLVTLSCPSEKLTGERTFMLVEVTAARTMAEAGGELKLRGRGFFCPDDRTAPARVALALPRRLPAHAVEPAGVAGGRRRGRVRVRARGLRRSGGEGHGAGLARRGDGQEAASPACRRRKPARLWR
ncbi:hypothetical protein [Nonomuraea monospora]